MSFGCDGTPGSVGEVAKQDRYDLCWNEEDAMIMKELEAQ